MRAAPATLGGVVLALLPFAMVAQPMDPIDLVQVGTFDCPFVMQFRDGIFRCVALPPNHFTPVKVPFDKAFGDKPTVVVSAVPASTGTCPPTLTVDPTGFYVNYGKCQTPPSDPTITAGTPVMSFTWTAVGPRLYTGTAKAQYLLLSVIYAPPGTKNGNRSSVTYQAGTTAQTLTSATQSFKDSHSVGVEGEIKALGSGSNVSMSVGVGTSTVDTQTLEVKTTVTQGINFPGPNQSDGIDHNYDQLLLLLNPTINLSLSSTRQSWTIADGSGTLLAIPLGYLTGAFPLAGTEYLNYLNSANITGAESLMKIACLDPLYLNPEKCTDHTLGTRDSKRFLYVTTLPYSPPPKPGDVVPSWPYSISDSSKYTTSHEASITYTVGLEAKGGVDFLGLAGVKLSQKNNWEWMQKTSASAYTEKTQAATVTLGGPSVSNLPVRVDVYRDTIYQTFAFSYAAPPPAGSLSVKGTVLDRTGKPAAGKQVLLTEGGRSHRTFTDARGAFEFVGKFEGDVSVQAGTVTAIATPGVKEKLEIKLP